MYGTIELTVTVIVTALPSSALRTGYAIETLSSADSIGAFLPAVAIPAALLTASIAFGIFWSNRNSLSCIHRQNISSNNCHQGNNIPQNRIGNRTSRSSMFVYRHDLSSKFVDLIGNHCFANSKWHLLRQESGQKEREQLT